MDLTTHPGVARDLRQLPTDDERRVALEYLRLLQRDPFVGEPLIRDLAGCYKVRFEGTDHPGRLLPHDKTRPGGPRFRVVYELVPNPERPERIHIIAIGTKEPTDPGEHIYRKAAERWIRDHDKQLPKPRVDPPPRTHPRRARDRD